MKIRISVVLLCLVLFTPGVLISSNLQPVPKLEESLTSVKHLPKDPLLAWSADVGSFVVIYDALIETVRNFLPAEEQPEFDSDLAEIDQKLGFRLREDLLAHLGPEIAVVIDFPPVDLAAGSIMSGSPAILKL